jgi:hypothetical protein
LGNQCRELSQCVVYGLLLSMSQSLFDPSLPYFLHSPLFLSLSLVSPTFSHFLFPFLFFSPLFFPLPHVLFTVSVPLSSAHLSFLLSYIFIPFSPLLSFLLPLLFCPSSSFYHSSPPPLSFSSLFSFFSLPSFLLLSFLSPLSTSL